MARVALPLGVVLLAGLSACTEYGFSKEIPVAEPNDDPAYSPRYGGQDTATDTGWNPVTDTASTASTDTGTPVEDTEPPEDTDPPEEEEEDKCYEPENGYETNAAARIMTDDSSTAIVVEFVYSDTSYQNDLYEDAPEGRFLMHAWESTAGDSTSFGPYARDTEIIFGIYVNNTGDYWRSGAGSRNADGQAHVAVTYEGGCSWLIGFEDLYGGGDRDYNDVVLRVSGRLYQSG